MIQIRQLSSFVQPLIVAVYIFVTGTTAAQAANKEWTDPFLEGNFALYPQPKALDTVQRAAKILRNPSMESVPVNAASISNSANAGARIDILQVIHSNEIAGVTAPNGMEAVTLVTRWENVHPKAKIPRSKMEKGADRTYGAGGLFAGGSPGGAAKEDMVEMDVAYLVPQAGQHLWLVAGGEAWGVRPESAALPNGADPLKPIGISRFGERREVRLAWFVPKGFTDLQLRLFDYDNGHITATIAGDPIKAAAPQQVKAIDTGKISEMEVSVLGLNLADEYAGQKAPQGWRFALVDLQGKGIVKQNDMGALIQLDPTRYTWLSGDGGVLRYGLPPEDGSSLLVFTPELPRRQSVAFLVPEKEVNFRIGLRGRADVASLKATLQEPAALPETVARITDAGSLVLGLAGLRWEGDALIADFVATPQVNGKGVEIDPVRQFTLVAGDAAFHPDESLTRRLYRQPPTPFVMPPETPVRFELAFVIPKDAVLKRLDYQGFISKSPFPLEGQTIGGTRGTAGNNLAAGALPTVVPKPLAIAPEPPAPGTISVAPMASQVAADSVQADGKPVLAKTSKPPVDPFKSTSEPAKLMPISLPPFDSVQALAEVEPNDKIEQATKFGSGLATSAAMSGEDWHDWFSFSVEGEPQLWSIEGSGPGLGRITVVAPGERKLGETQSLAGELKPGETLRVDNVLLLPGRYWIDAERRSGMAGGTYNLRAVPLGRPDRTAEFEPNDHVSQALPLEFGMPRRGLIGRESDVDLYRFFLTTATHLRLTLTPPPGLPTILKLEGNGLSQRMDPLPGDDKKLSYDALLQPGIYTVNVYADGQEKSETPYELSLDRLDPFSLPVDIEPNDTAPMAVPLGARRQFSGTVGRFDQSDYFRLPELKAKTVFTVTGEGKISFDIAQIVDGTDKRTESVELQEKRTDTAKTYQATLEPGIAYMLRVNGSEPYRMSLSFNPDPGGTADVAPGNALELNFSGKPPFFAAYRDEAQEASLGVKVTNHSPDVQEVTLEATAAETGWQIDFPNKTLTLTPGQSTEAVGYLRAAPDRSALREMPIYVRARGKSVASAAASLPVMASCTAPTLGPIHEQPLPTALLGGLNLAWSALGGQPAAADAAVRQRQAQLFDGMTPLQQQFELKPWEEGNEIDVQLAGAGPVQIAGVTLVPANTEGYLVDRAHFTVSSSLDGKAYAPVYSGIMEPTEIEQAFVFDKPHDATHLRLQFAAVDGLRYSGGTKLAEWKAIAMPGLHPLGDFNPNLAAPALGGHLVWVSWDHSDYSSESAILTETDEQRYFRIEALKPVEWVVGFHNDRAARIASLQWRESANAEQGYRRVELVAVSASMKGPTGPWLPVGDWKLPGSPGDEAELVLPAPVWARFLRFSAPAYDKTVSLRIAETLRIFEQAEDDSYRSVLGEWGHYRRDAYYEALKIEGRSAGAKTSAGGDTRERAIQLSTDKQLAGRVEVGKRVDWFQVNVPTNLDRLEFAFGGNDASRLEPMLEDKNGSAILLEEADETSMGRIFYARVTPGAVYYLKVAEAKRSIMIVWDNSSSVGSFHETMYRSISRLADDIRPGEEVVNLMPLVEGENPRTLMPDWSEDPLAVKRAIGEYDRKDTSSNSEHTLLGALNHLAERPGNRGIVLLTDADSNGQGENAPLWLELGKVRPRIFTVELQLNSDGAAVSHFQDLMQDWAAVNNGYYSVFHNQADLDVAFDRAACRMRQPAEYDVSWHPAPGTGTLIVEWEKGKAMAGATVELIFDASGSMVSPKNKVGGKLKMDVAREVMLEIVGMLPIDTQVGLRLYGHRRRDGTEGACEDSELVAPIAQLDRGRLEERIKGVKALGGTPIAYSLTEAGKDMANIKGPQLILLVTDGKEECNGNPAAVAEALKTQGINARIDIVGFALTDQKDKDDMTQVAKIAGGRFFDAQNRADLAASIAESLAMPFEVTDSRGRQVSEGLTGQSPNALYPGNYSVIVHAAQGDVTVRDVKIMEGLPTKLILSREGDEIKTRIEGSVPAK